MSNLPSPTVTPLRDVIVAAVRRDRAAKVARDLDVPRSAVVAYCAGTARAGTILVVESRWERLSGGGKAA